MEIIKIMYEHWAITALFMLIATGFFPVIINKK